MVTCLTDNTLNENTSEVFDITEGTNLTLICSADSVPSPSSYSWSGLITSATANLTLFVSKNHSGDLICTANNTMKETHGNITIGTRSKLYHMNVLCKCLTFFLYISSCVCVQLKYKRSVKHINVSFLFLNLNVGFKGTNI